MANLWVEPLESFTRDMTKQTLENEYASVTVDTRGRLVSLVNKQTGTELITNPEAAEAWRMVLPTGRHRIDMLLGSEQKPQRIQIERTDRARRLCICYDRLTGRRTWRIRAETMETMDRPWRPRAKPTA